VLLTLLAVVAGWRSRTVSSVRAASLVLASAAVAFAVVRTVWALWERARPEETVEGLVSPGHTFAPFASFPSGHAAVTVAMVLALALLFPRLALPLGLWAGLVCASRVVYGAHFTSDVLVGVAVGVAAVLLARRALAAVAAPDEKRGLQ
jgi:membrane-associated phospholipid phosphatase